VVTTVGRPPPVRKGEAHRLSISLIVSLSSRVSADLTTYPSETQLDRSCLNSPYAEQRMTGWSLLMFFMAFSV